MVIVPGKVNALVVMSEDNLVEDARTLEEYGVTFDTDGKSLFAEVGSHRKNVTEDPVIVIPMENLGEAA